MDTTTNQKLVSAMGGTLKEACNCGTNVQWWRGRGGIDWGSIADMAIRGVPLQNTTIKQALGTLHMCYLIVTRSFVGGSTQAVPAPPPPLWLNVLFLPTSVSSVAAEGVWDSTRLSQGVAVNTITTDIKRRKKNTKYKWGKLSPRNTWGKWDKIPLTSLLETKIYNREFHLKF